MNVGDYVRTEEGIAKYTGDKATEEGTYYFVDRFFDDHFDGWENIICKDEIIKSSPNIIDLIEVGDYVNGHRVVEVNLDDIDDYGNDFRYIKTEHDYTLNYWIKENEIKSIVTKEQFSQTEYKIQ